ncbi:MAG: hypothetical protein D6785_15770 [Planctomycetota bacterium]|nr:MAG: hypothetical protein D6785_15770 [Planctomycetota bacterium]
MGENPRLALIEKLKAEMATTSDPAKKASIEKVIDKLSRSKTYDSLFGLDSKDIFKRGANAEKMKRFESWLAKMAKENPGIKAFQPVVKSGEIPLPGGVDVSRLEPARNITNNVLNMDEYIVRTRDGKTEALKVVANYYGDTMGDVGRALVDSGVKKIGYFGTAGGVSTPEHPVKVGDIHIPKKIYDPHGNLANEGVENAFLHSLKPESLDPSLRKSVKLGTNLGNVRSPMVETNDWLEKVKSEGLNSVEVETSHLARGVREAAKNNGVKPELYTSVIISDVPGSEETLDKLDPSKRKKSFSRMLDQYLDVMGIEDIALREKTTSAERINPTFVDAPTDKAYRLAEKLLPKRLKDHVMLRDHIARILRENLGSQALENINLEKKVRVEDLPLPEAVKADLRGRIEQPYSDKALLRELEFGNAKLSFLAKALNENAHGRNFDLKLLGDMAKGTFNGREILFTVDNADPAFREMIKKKVAELNNGKGPKLRFVENPTGMPEISLKNGRGFLTQPDYLQKVYADRMYEKSGLILRNDWAGRPVFEYDDLRRKEGRNPSMLEALAEAGLYANYSAASNSPEVDINSEKFKRFKAKVEKYGGSIEFIDPATDPRWEAGATGKTIVDADGKIKILLPKGKKVRSLAMLEEFTHLMDLRRMINEYGSDKVREVFEKANSGDKQARARLLNMEARAKKMALLNMDKSNPLRAEVEKELKAINSELDKMYDRTKDVKKLIEAEDYYSLGRKMEELVKKRGMLEKVDAEMRRVIRENIEILKYGDLTPESKKITLVRGVKNDKVWGEKNGRPFMLNNRVNHGRSGWDNRFEAGFERYLKEAHSRNGDGSIIKLETLMYDHAASSNNSARSFLISSSGTAKSIWGPPFYVIRVNPKRALFNYKSPFPNEAEVLIPFFVLPNEIVRKYNSYNEAINDPYVKNSPYYKIATEGGSYYYGSNNITEKWKTIYENIKNGRDPIEGIEGLNSRFSTYNVGPNAEKSMIEKFKAKLKKYGAELEWVSSNDPRLAKDGQARTYVTSDGKIKVLLPKDKPVKKFALIDEFTHVLQIHNMAKKYGKETVAEIFKAALGGDPMAKDLLLQWEIKAKENILLTLDKKDPNRKLVEESIAELKKEADPLYRYRKPNGTLNWSKVKEGLKEGALGIAHFSLALFLKELAVAVKSRDKFVIEEFFDGLMSVGFYTEYGLFSVGSMGGEFVYTRFLEKYIKPRFINNMLKSTLVMAAGMALPDIIHGRFDGRAFAINLSGLFISSAAVKAGINAIRWAIPLEKLASQATWIKRLANVYKASKWAKIGGWFYTAAETAVVLYFGDEISKAITKYLDKREAKKKVGEATQKFLDAVKSGNKAEIEKAAAELEDAYNAYREFLYQPLKEEEMKLMMRLNKMGKELKGLQDAYNRYMDLYNSDPVKYAALKTMADNLKNGKIRDLERDMEEAFKIYERNRGKLLKEIYTDNLRNAPLVNNDIDTINALDGRTGGGVGGLFDRATNWWKARSIKKAFSNPSDNRLETYADEGDILRLALAMTSRKDIRDMLNLKLDELKILASTDKALFEGTMASERSTSSSPASSGDRREEPLDTEGILKRLMRAGR